MDNLTHSLFAITLGRTPLGRAGRGTTAALLIASNAPDADIIAVAGGTAKYLEWHRGMTHGPLGVVGLSVIVAALVHVGRAAWDRRRAAQAKSPPATSPDASLPMLVALSLVGVTFHILMDLPTAYGVRVLSPFSWRWFGVDWMPIVDVYLLIVMGSGLLFARPTPAAADAKRRNAAIVLGLMAVNYGVRGYAHHEALTLAPRLFGPTLPRPCEPEPRQPSIVDRWPLPTSPALASGPDGRRCLVEIAAMPTFLSPFDWRIIAQMSNAYEIHDVNILDSRFNEPASESEVFWRQVLRYPNLWTPAVERAAGTHLGQMFLGFSRFPAARTAVDARGATTVRFTDVRFVSGAIASDQPIRRVQPFTATIKFDPEGNVISQALGQ